MEFHEQTTPNPTITTCFVTAFIEKEQMLKDRIYPVVRGLLRMDKFNTALQDHQKLLMSEVKSLTNKVLDFIILALSSYIFCRQFRGTYVSWAASPF
jgi:hypothetical protein